MSENNNSETTQDKEQINIGNWYLLRFNKMSVKQMKEILEATTIEHFLPSYISIENGAHGKKIKRERALMFNMLFLHCTLKEAVQFVTLHKNINFVVKYVNNDLKPSISLNKFIDRDKEQGEERMIPKYDDATFRYVVTVPNNQVRMFIKTVNNNKSFDTPYLRPTEIDLEKGDKVRIIGGDYNGVEGILESQKGKDGGTVFVHIQNFIATRTTEIRPEFIQILEFAKNGRHMYKKFDSFMTRGERCVKSLLHRENISQRDKEYFKIFTLRFKELNTPTSNMTAKLLLYMFIAYSCIGEYDKAKEYEEKLKAYLCNINSEQLICKCITYLYACTSDTQYKKLFFNTLKNWGYSPGENSKRDEYKQVFFDIQWIVESNEE